MSADDASAPSTRKRVTVTRVRGAILQLIEEQKLSTGDRIDTEDALAKRLRVSRSIVRNALKSLEQEGFVHVVRGRGRFVSGLAPLTVDRPLTKYESTTEMLASRGYDVTSVVIDVEEVPATEVEAEALRIPVGAPVIRLVRLRLGNGRPMVVSVNVVLREALPGPVKYRDWDASLMSALENHGHRIVASIANMSAADLPEDLATRLGLEDLGPWMRVDETCISHAGKRLIFASEYYRGSEITFSFVRRRK